MAGGFSSSICLVVLASISTAASPVARISRSLHEQEDLGDCADWCNVDICSMDQCVGCENRPTHDCAKLAAGTYCAGWCNVYICSDFHCRGCSDCGGSKTVVIDGESHLSIGGERVIFNGVNVAWINYGWDFNATADPMSSICGIHDVLRLVTNSGGNAIRMWMFQDAMSDPTKAPFFMDESGRVTGLRPGVVDLAREYLDLAASYGVLVIFVLWNGAYIEGAPDALTCRMLTNETVLSSIIEHVVRPLAAALDGHPALAAWEVMNEPGGLVNFTVRNSSSTCTDLDAVQSKGREDGGGWVSGCLLPVTTIQRVLNQQIAAIKAAAPHHLVTGSSWSPSAISHTFGENLWADDCLVTAGGEASGTIDVWQPHDYAKILPSYGGLPFGPGWCVSRRPRTHCLQARTSPPPHLPTDDAMCQAWRVQGVRVRFAWACHRG